MTEALSRLMSSVNQPVARNELWDQAIVQAGRSRARSAAGDSAAVRMQRLKQTLERELVAFHDRLPATAAESAGRWSVAIPLTLFPQRDRGFTRVECVVEFKVADGPPDGLRVIEVYPEKRSKVFAQAELGGSIDLKTTLKLGIPAPALGGLAVANAAVDLYGKGTAGPFIYKAERMCADSEIVNGTGARWRLDDMHEPQKVGVESHQMRVVLDVDPQTKKVEAAGYLNAYSETRWLTSEVSSIWRDFKGKLLEFFSRGAPAEAFAEWDDILPLSK